MSGADPVVAILASLVDAIEAETTFDPEYDALVIRDEAIQRKLHTRALSAIDRYAPPNSVYQKQAEGMRLNPNLAPEVGQLLAALRDDYVEGGMRSLSELVHASLFDDFLEMAGELHDKGFHGPAAVVAGSVLEEHVRKLATKHEVELRTERDRPKSFDALVVELVKKQVFSAARQEILTGWYGQRTEGAHGRPENVVPEEVPRMVSGIRDFIVSHPA